MAFAASQSAFGLDLDAHLSDQRQKFGKDSIPYVLSGCETFLRTALATPGLFRQDVEPDELAQLRGRIEAAYAVRRPLELATLTRNWHAAAGLLKLYLKELPQPLLTFKLFPYFLAADEGGNVMEKLGNLIDLLSRLPPSAFRSLKLVLVLLHDTTVVNPVMKAADLAKIFAPLLFRSQGGLAPHDRPRAEAVLTLMISNAAADGALISSVQSKAVDKLGSQMASVSVSPATYGAGSVPEDAQWYYIDAQQNYVGPVDTHGLQQLRAHKYVHADTYVWSEHLAGSQWQRLSSLPEFQEASSLPPAPASLPELPSAPPVAPSLSVPAAPVLFGGRAAASTTVGSVNAALPMRPTYAGTSGGAGGVAAPPSLGMAVARRRQATNEGADRLPGGLPGGLSGMAERQNAVLLPRTTVSPSMAGPPTLGGGRAASTSSGVPLNDVLAQYRGAGAALPGGEKQSSALPANMPVGMQSGISRASVSIPTPVMVPLEHSQSEWPSGQGMRLLSGARDIRAIISEDGEVKDGSGVTLAFIEANGEVGDSSMNYAGKAHHASNQVVDKDDVVLGDFDSGRGYVRDAQGSVVAELSKEGHVKNNGGQSVCFIDGFTFKEMGTLAAYFLLVDPAFLRTHTMSTVGLR